MKYSKFILLLTWIIIGFQNDVQTQTKILSSVISNGCKSVYGNNVQINGTLGQPVIGIVNNLETTVYYGFWFQTSLNNITDMEQMKPDLLPKEFLLKQNYPNPFNPTTIIKYSIPNNSVMLNSFKHLNNETSKQVRGDNANVQLKVYDILGKELATLVNNKQSPGNYEVTFNANNFPSGVYFYQLKSKEFVKVRKMMLVR